MHSVNDSKTQRRKSLFDWPVAFTKVILIVANCTLASFALMIVSIMIVSNFHFYVLYIDE